VSRRIPLLETARGLFDVNGKAVARHQPQRPFEAWHVTYTSIDTTSASLSACKVYRNFESPTNFIESSIFNGNSDSSDTEMNLAPGETLLYVWTGGTPGAIATVSIRGDRLVT